MQFGLGKRTAEWHKAMTRYMRPPPKYKLILASQSPRRKHLLAEAGIFVDQVIAADIDETPMKNERPADYVLRMAQQRLMLLPAEQAVSLFCLRIQLLYAGSVLYPRLKQQKRRDAVFNFCQVEVIVSMAVSVCICRVANGGQNCLSAALSSDL